MKICPTCVIGEMQTETTINTSIRIAKIQHTDNKQRWGYGTNGILVHHYWECKTVQPLWVWSHHFMANRCGNSDRFYFGGAPKSLQMMTAAMKLKDACSQKKSYDQPGQHIKKQKHYFATKVCLVKAMVFPVVIMDVKVGLYRKSSIKELMLLNYGVGEDSWESLGLQGDPTSPS